jgi:gas vesicle protein
MELQNYQTTAGNAARSGSNLGTNLSYLLIGGGIGAAVALLFAPKAGDALRGDIADVTRRGYEGLKDQSTTVAQTVKEKAGAVLDYTSQKLNPPSDVISRTLEGAANDIGKGADKLENDAATSFRKTENEFKGSSIV